MRPTYVAIVFGLTVPSLSHALDVGELRSICADGAEEIACSAYIRGAIDAMPQAAFKGWLEARKGKELSSDGLGTELLGYCFYDDEPFARVIDRVADGLEFFTEDFDASSAISVSLRKLYPCR